MPAIQVADLNNGKVDVDHIGAFANSTALTATDRLGRTKRTLAGIDAEAESRMDAQDVAAVEQRLAIQAYANVLLGSLGYLVPVAYGPGLAMTAPNQTVSYGDNTYAPIESELPFTTSGVFEVSKFRLIQGVSGADLGSPLGSVLVGNVDAAARWANVAQYISYADARAAAVSVIPADKATFAAALQYCVDNDRTLEVPDGLYSGPDIVMSEAVKMRLSPGAHLDFSVEIVGQPYATSNSVTLAGAWATFPIGTTNFAGNFSAFAPGDVVVVELTDAGSAANGNEAGIDILVVQSASGAALVTTTGTRLPYQNPKISKLAGAARHTGTLARHAYVIPGNYTAILAVGDVARIENMSGTDGVEASSFYFDFVRVAEIDATQVTLEHSLYHTYTDPWIVKTGFIHGVKIDGGGRIKRLRIGNADDVFVNGVDIDRSIMGSIYNIGVDGSQRKGLGEASTSNHTFIFGGYISNVVCGGSVSTTDNAAFKFLSCPGVRFHNIHGGNTKATGAQGNYGVFGDFFYTPYRIWNDQTCVSLATADVPRSPVTRSAWFTGFRSGYVRYVGSKPFLQSSIDTTFETVCPEFQLEVKDLVRCRVKADAKFITWDGGFDSHLDAAVRSPAGASSNRCVWARAGAKNPETGAVYTSGDNNRFDVVNYGVSASDTSLYIQSQSSPLVGGKSRDKAGNANSIAFGSGVATPNMEPNFFTNAIPVSNAWLGARTKGPFRIDGGYQDGLLQIGPNNYWTSGTSKYYTNPLRPTSTADGTVVGTQT